MNPTKMICVIGGTGLGKTKLGIQLCEAINGEVVNADAMQLYKGLRVATAAATREEMRGVPHHLLSIVDPAEKWTVREYRDEALKVIDEVARRGKTPVIVGGTCYYAQALIWKSLLDEQEFVEHHQQQKRDDDDDDDGIKTASSLTPHEELAKVDPDMAARLHPNDVRKIQRSLEVFRTTNRKHSEVLGTADAKAEPVRFSNCRIIWLTCDPLVHERRLRERIDKMFEEGLVEEARAFMERYCAGDGEKGSTDTARGVFQAIGYREVEPLVSPARRSDEEGKKKKSSSLTLEQECKERLLIHHRQYSKKQIRWIKNRFCARSDVPVYAVDVSEVFRGSSSTPGEQQHESEVERRWRERVLTPCLEIARFEHDKGREFIVNEGGEVTSNSTSSTSANPAEKKIMRRCEACGGRSIPEVNWSAHLASRGHKSRVRPPREEDASKEKRIKSVLETEDGGGLRNTGDV